MTETKTKHVEMLAKQIVELQERLREAEEKAEEMTRLKSSLLTNMSHEIRTPLTSMLAHAAILESRLDDENLEAVRAIKRAGARLTETLNSVLTLAQLDGQFLQPSPEDLDLVELVTETVDSLRPQADDKELALYVSAQQDELPTHCDPRCMRRILVNLIENAVKFTDHGEIEVAVSTDDDDIIIEVRDTGAGISEDFIHDMFEEFTQESTGLTRTHEGSGLGLAITKRLVEAMDGAIDVDSEKDRGTTFKVRLPWIDACAPQDSNDETCDLAAMLAKSARCGSSQTLPSMSVLLVEDNRDIRRVLSQLLEALGDVVTCSDAETALRAAGEREFDVVIMDISLPRMDGVQALQKLRTMNGYQDIPVIAMTGHALPGDRERFLEAGFTDYIGKPFPPSALLKKLRKRLCS
ncbi:response regulator [Persicimonas caeni]|uniref:histidine kinase n=1 Tax=Persicimonas caeni TaxID=2292766 RepID=A0A4Y6Q0U7_PERCE|nr:ATP-binding protein [Persicimonas caeni]QDG53847.1 response regulator [Persicimonas caeni]QED35068.1 response regulator [Persicimonas caeni]